MIKPIFVAWNLYPSKTGGIEVFNFHFIKWLSKQEGISPTLVTAVDTIVPEGIKAKKYNVKVKRFGNVINVLSLLKACISIKDKNKVIFLSFSKSSWKIWAGYSLIAYLLHIPYVIYIHGGGMYPWKHKRVMQRVFQNADSLFCVSPEQKAEYEQRISKSIQVLAPIVPFENFDRDRSFLEKSYGINDENFVFLYLGSLRNIKGTDILIKAFLALGNFPVENNIHLLLVGGGDTKHYADLLSESPNTTNVHFVGKVSNEIVGKYYALADCFVLPSRVEGMPIALIQALSNKLPTIVSDLPTIPKIFSSGKNCLKFPSEDYQTLSNKMKYIYLNKFERTNIALNGHKLYIDNWSSNNTFETLLKAMKNAAVK